MTFKKFDKIILAQKLLLKCCLNWLMERRKDRKETEKGERERSRERGRKRSEGGKGERETLIDCK